MTIDLLTFLPGYCQGLSKCFTTYPFDVIKIKMQRLLLRYSHKV